MTKLSCITFLVFLWALCLAQPIEGFAQQVRLHGHVKDSLNGETLIGVSIKLLGQKQAGVSSNAYGYFSATISPGKYQLTASYIGYRSYTSELEILDDTRLNISLFPDNVMDEVIITDRATNDNVINPQMGIAKLNLSEIKNVPVLFGESDVLKTLQLLPGIKSAGEGNSGIYVRGGAADQNLILLDEAPVYNASHLLGFFSTFNSDAIKDVSVYKGGMPAQYGGRLSSVLDIRMNDGNKKEFAAEGGIGLISSRLKVEGPLVKDRSSFMLSARRTYADVFLGLARDTLIRENTLYFYDINAKLNYQIDDRNTIYLSGYFGRDELGLSETFGFDWGNATATLRWNHLYNSKLFSNTSLIYSNYNYVIQNFLEESNFKVNSAIKDLNLKHDFQFSLNNRHNLRFGAEIISHNIDPGKITAGAESSVNQLEIERRKGMETAIYISDEWALNDKINFVYGLRSSFFGMYGPGTFYNYNAQGEVTTAENFPKNRLVKSYVRLEPRFSASITLDSMSSLKASFTRNVQNIHLMSNSTASSPTDLYIMSSNNVKPEQADQIGLGYFRNFSDNRFEFSTEVYYKELSNQIEYRSGTDLRGNSQVEAELLYGDGRAYGLELFLKKRYGKLHGWLGYTLSKTERQFSSINAGKWFNAKQDRTHDISLVGIYQAGKRWTLSSTFVYSTGNAVTFPAGKYQINGNTLYYYAGRNTDRMPAYHRLDLAATLEARPENKIGSSWSFGIYNLYNRKNAYLINFREDPDDSNLTQAVRTNLFGIIPSVTWNFKF